MYRQNMLHLDNLVFGRELYRSCSDYDDDSITPSVNIDEIDYFPKRDKFKTRKDVGLDWKKLKKQKTTQPSKVKPPKSSPDEEEKK